MSLQHWLEQRWYGGGPPAWPLRLLAGLFALLSQGRRALYRRGVLSSTRLPVPVLVVGNLTVGGSGKTPLVIALCQTLRARGWRPAVVSRGYGRRHRDARLVMADSTAAEVGDEPRLIAARSGCPVAVAARRADAARLLLATGAVDLIIADDGLQHYALQRDVEIAVIDAVRGLGNRQLLPAGPLRELPSRLQRCDFIVLNAGQDQSWDGLPAAPMQLELGSPYRLRDGAVGDWAALAAQRPLHALAGIGHPPRFFAALRSRGLDPIVHPFPDHHPFAPADLAFATAQTLLMTEKDAVKCRPWAAPDWWAVPVEAHLPASFVTALDSRLRQSKQGVQNERN